MHKTGSSILFVFSLAAILLPLLPLAMILIRRSFDKPKMGVLAALCLIAFFRQVLLLVAPSPQSDDQFINALFDVAELTALMFLFRAVIQHKRLRQLFPPIMASLLSVVLTVYFLKGVSAYASGIGIFLSIFILLVSLLAIGYIMIDEQSFILSSPVFWIASGTFCYEAMFLLSEAIRAYEHELTADTATERFILLAAVYMVRYVFYIIAAYVSGERQVNRLYSMDDE